MVNSSGFTLEASFVGLGWAENRLKVVFKSLVYNCLPEYLVMKQHVKVHVV